MEDEHAELVRVLARDDSYRHVLGTVVPEVAYSVIRMIVWIAIRIAGPNECQITVTGTVSVNSEAIS
jgi:hypothetical protein